MSTPDEVLEGLAQLNFEMSHPRDWEDESAAMKACYRAIARKQMDVVARPLMAYAWDQAVVAGMFMSPDYVAPPNPYEERT